MLAKVGLITDDDRAAIERGLKEIEAEIDETGPNWPGFDKQYEDIHMCVEKALIDKIGEPGRKLHTGRSRNDQVALDLTLWVADAKKKIIDEQLANLDRAWCELAQRAADIVMPSYTHLQRAQPISAAAEIDAWASAFNFCHTRFIDSSWHSDSNPLGSGAIAGSSLPLDRFYTSELLRSEDRQPTGFRYSDDNSIYSTANRDVAIDFVFGLTMVAQWLSRWAEQWIIYSTAEFGFIKTADRYTTGSSMMPQKRNPDMLELIRGRCGNVYGNLVALLTICKGLPIGYNRDLQEDKRHVFAAYDTVSSCLTMAAAIVNSTEFVKGRCEAACEGGFMDATSLAEYLVVKGIPFRTAHHVVGTLVSHCERDGRDEAERPERRRVQRGHRRQERRACGQGGVRLPRRTQRRGPLPERRRRGRRAVAEATCRVETAARALRRSRGLSAAAAPGPTAHDLPAARRAAATVGPCDTDPSATPA